MATFVLRIVVHIDIGIDCIVQKGMMDVLEIYIVSGKLGSDNVLSARAQASHTYTSR